MTCQNCNSERIVQISAKCSDQCNTRIGDKDICDYVPYDMNLGGGDYLTLKMCLDCGQVQGKFPLAQTELES